MKNSLFLIVPMFLLAFCVSPNPVLAEMKSSHLPEAGNYSPQVDPQTGRNSEYGRALQSQDGVRFDFQLGSAFLEIEGKSLLEDHGFRLGDMKSNMAVMIGLGFRF